MLKLKKSNANPKNRKTGDCVTRALTVCLNIPYEEILRLQYIAAVKGYYGITDKETAGIILSEYGYEKMPQPRKPDGKKYSVEEMDAITTPEQRAKGIYVTVAGHAVVIKGDEYIDIWDCGYKAVCNYWVKKGA